MTKRCTKCSVDKPIDSKPLDVRWLCRPCHSNHHLDLIRADCVGGGGAANAAVAHLETVS